MALPADVTDRASIEAAVASLGAAYGDVDILVNAAGGNQAGATIGPDASFCESFSIEAFDQITKLNLVGTILPCKLFGAVMVSDATLYCPFQRLEDNCPELIVTTWRQEKNKKGVIVNISSMAAQQTITRVCGYSASKAAIDNFTKWLAVELSTKLGDGIRVNALGERAITRALSMCLCVCVCLCVFPSSSVELSLNFRRVLPLGIPITAPGFFLAEQNRKLLTNDDGTLTSRGETIIKNTPFGKFLQ